jgi:hypothetical protein
MAVLVVKNQVPVVVWILLSTTFFIYKAPIALAQTTTKCQMGETSHMRGGCDSSLSRGAIIGLAVGGAVLALFCIAVAVCYFSRRSKENRSNDAPTEDVIASR